MQNSWILLLFLIAKGSYAQDSLPIRNAQQTEEIVKRFEEITGKKTVRETNSQSEKAVGQTTIVETCPKEVLDSMDQLKVELIEADKNILVLRYGGTPVYSDKEQYDDFKGNRYLQSSSQQKEGVQIFFSYNQSLADFKIYTELDEFVANWRKDPKQLIQVKGYADAIGDFNYNKYLSLLRAEETKKYLVLKYDIPVTSIKVLGLGDNAEDRYKDPKMDFLNRRALVRIVN